MIKLKYPPVIHWEVTPECNHNCIHCYNYWRKESTSNVQTNILDKEYYLKMAIQISQNKPVVVVITGGEPLLVFDKIKIAIDYFLDNNIFVSINTNVALITEEIATYIREKNIPLFISFPSSDKNICNFITNRNNSYENIIKGMNLIYNYNLYFTPNIVVSKLNIRQIESSIEFLIKEYHLKKICITRVGKPINSSIDFNKMMLDYKDIEYLQNIILKIVKAYSIEIDTACPYTPCSLYTSESFNYFAYKKICTAGKTSYSIDFLGNVKACPRESINYGNINTDNFHLIWENMKNWRNGSFTPVECKNCKEFTKCLGGCRMDSYPFTQVYTDLDCISNPANLPVRYYKLKKTSRHYHKNTVFYVYNSINFVKEDNFYRISNNSKYCYVTEEFAIYLMKHSKFSLQGITNQFTINDNAIYDIIDVLILNNIIYRNT